MLLSAQLLPPIGFSTFINVTLIGFDVTIFVLILPQFRGKKGGIIVRQWMASPETQFYARYVGDAFNRDHALDTISSSYNETSHWCDLWMNAYCWIWNAYARCHVHRQTRQSCPKRATTGVSLKDENIRLYHNINMHSINPRTILNLWALATCFQCLCHCCAFLPANGRCVHSMQNKAGPNVQITLTDWSILLSIVTCNMSIIVVVTRKQYIWDRATQNI